MFISVNGFSPEVIRSLVMGKEIQTLFIDGEDLVLVLEGHLSLREMIDRKVKAAQTKGLIYVHPISGAEKNSKDDQTWRNSTIGAWRSMFR